MATGMGWFFVVTMNACLLLGMYLAVSDYGKVRLGGPEAEPEFTMSGWFAMLFSAGMGIGLLFYGVAEPLFHLSNPPRSAEPGTVEAAQEAMLFTFLHWGLHPWALYATVGLALAFYTFNRGLPLSIRSILQPLVGDEMYGWKGDVVDILASVATMCGIATSLGLGVQQVNAGLTVVSSRYLPVTIPTGTLTQCVLIVIITGIATMSVVRGLDSGIQALSKLNVYLAAALMMFVFVFGPTGFILDGFLQNIGFYLQHPPELASE